MNQLHLQDDAQNRPHTATEEICKQERSAARSENAPGCLTRTECEATNRKHALIEDKTPAVKLLPAVFLCSESVRAFREENLGRERRSLSLRVDGPQGLLLSNVRDAVEKHSKKSLQRSWSCQRDTLTTSATHRHTFSEFFIVSVALEVCVHDYHHSSLYLLRYFHPDNECNDLFDHSSNKEVSPCLTDYTGFGLTWIPHKRWDNSSDPPCSSPGA
eukprot:764711-Hanusia_phi.AAC.2